MCQGSELGLGSGVLVRGGVLVGSAAYLIDCGPTLWLGEEGGGGQGRRNATLTCDIKTTAHHFPKLLLVTFAHSAFNQNRTHFASFVFAVSIIADTANYSSIMAAPTPADAVGDPPLYPNSRVVLELSSNLRVASVRNS